MASKIARGISLITNKSIVGIILTLVIICSTYFHNSNADISSLILLVIFLSFIPLISSKFKNINDIPPLTYLISYLIGLLVSVAFNIDMLISAILACFSINMLILFLIDRKYGIDINTHGIAEALCILTIFIGPDAGFLAMLYPLSVWSRLKLDENSIFWENAWPTGFVCNSNNNVYPITIPFLFRSFGDRLCNIYSYISIQHNLLLRDKL